MEQKPICCLCGNICENEYGNNPYPVDKEENHRCCDKCNIEKVIPARIQELAENKN